MDGFEYHHSGGGGAGTPARTHKTQAMSSSTAPLPQSPSATASFKLQPFTQQDMVASITGGVTWGVIALIAVCVVVWMVQVMRQRVILLPGEDRDLSDRRRPLAQDNDDEVLLTHSQENLHV